MYCLYSDRPVSRFVKVWRVEAWEEDVRQTEVTEIDTLRDHTDYINAAVIRDNCLYSSSGELSLVDTCDDTDC